MSVKIAECCCGAGVRGCDLCKPSSSSLRIIDGAAASSSSALGDSALGLTVSDQQASTSRQRNLQSLWSFFMSAYSQLNMSKQDNSLGIFQLIRDAYEENKNVQKCLDTVFFSQSDQDLLTDFIIWNMCQFFWVLTTPKFKHLSHLTIECHYFLNKFVVDKNESVFGSVVSSYSAFIKELLVFYQKLTGENAEPSINSELFNTCTLEVNMFGRYPITTNLNVHGKPVEFHQEFTIPDFHSVQNLIGNYLLVVIEFKDYIIEPYETLTILEAIQEFFPLFRRPVMEASFHFLARLPAETLWLPCVTCWFGHCYSLVIHERENVDENVLLYSKFLRIIMKHSSISAPQLYERLVNIYNCHRDTYCPQGVSEGFAELSKVGVLLLEKTYECGLLGSVGGFVDKLVYCINEENSLYPVLIEQACCYLSLLTKHLKSLTPDGESKSIELRCLSHIEQGKENLEEEKGYCPQNLIQERADYYRENLKIDRENLEAYKRCNELLEESNAIVKHK